MVRGISGQITRYCAFIDVDMKNIIDKCSKSWSMTIGVFICGKKLFE